jgi:hypothetical protein
LVYGSFLGSNAEWNPNARLRTQLRVWLGGGSIRPKTQTFGYLVRGALDDQRSLNALKPPVAVSIDHSGISRSPLAELA